MQIYICLFFVVAVPTLATASQQSSNCIVGCKCQEDLNAAVRKLKITDCDSPLTLSKESINISEEIPTIAIAIKNVVIKKIEKDAFIGFKDLDGILFEDANIGSIHSSAFDLEQLTTVSFTRTTFGEIPMLSSRSLEELIFSDCKLTQVPNLEQLPSLTFLNLANNKIKNIDESTFAKVKSLEEVTLSNNSITKLPVNLFVNNLDFNTLNVDYNPLEFFQLNLTSELELLSLRFCKIKTFDRNSAVNLNSLGSLALGGNEISVLPIDAFETMKDLNNLDLSSNKLVELDADIFLHNGNLDRISLDDNQFESLPNFQTKSKIFATYYFSCKNCGLKSVKGTFENMPALVSIDLSNNKIDDIEEVFTEMHGLQNLNLANNSIATIANAISKKTALSTLSLAYNPLKPLDPVVFANIQSLNELNVSNSGLDRLWANHNSVIPTLNKLYVGNNSITVISLEDLKVTPKLQLLDVHNNPLVCTQEMNDFLKYVSVNQIHPIENIDALKTHETLTSQLTTAEELDSDSTWKKLAIKCDMDYSIFNDDEDDDDDDDDDFFDEDENDLGDKIILPTESTDDDAVYYGNEDDEKIYSKDELDDIFLRAEPKIIDERNFSLANASYILSITSVFILTALVVLTVAVTITLLILKRNRNFNMHNGNLPRLKVPLWHTTPGHKKHSGSVYKPLSEDLSGPRTPIINRYEFKQTPQVHSIP